jgi:hypothetical protein
MLFAVLLSSSVARLASASAQEKAIGSASQEASNAVVAAVPRDTFLSTEALNEHTKQLSQELLLKALDSEALYTLVGHLKPVSEGFWGGYFSVDPADLTEMEQVRAALRSWNVPGLFYADVLVYESRQHGHRYASAYVVHVPSLKMLIERESDFFARWGITVDTPPGEIMMAIERSRQPDDRWRGFGLVFGYPKYAIDFFVTAGMHQRSTGEFVERDFRQIATFAGRSGRFVYAVPKLSRPNAEDISLQRRAATLLSEYKRLRPQYTKPTKDPSGLLRDWMDDGNGKCHPDHLVAKLPARSEAELDAEIASWSVPEKRPPDIKFNHLYIVLSHADFEAVRTSDFLLNQFAASDQGFPRFLPADDRSQSICLRGRDTYIELFGPDNKIDEPVGKIGVGWSVEKVGELDVVQNLLDQNSLVGFTRVLNQWHFDREGAAVNWYHSLSRDQSSPGDAVWWFSETHIDFIPALYPNDLGDRGRISRRDFLESRFDAKRLLKNVTNITIELPLEAARNLRSDLESLGWNIEEFDSRTWILKSSDFRLMVMVQPDGSQVKINRIGFEINPGVNAPNQQPVGNRIEVSFDGKQSGWLQFK